MRTFLTFFLTIVFTFSSLAFALTAYAQEESDKDELVVTDKEVVYELPYAGILPDNPLYPMKKFRDAVWVFMTRDNMQKAELILLLSDKKVVMAQQLVDKGKYELAVETLHDAEDDYERIINAMKLSKQIGAEAPAEFESKVILSNEKHLEVMENILKTVPSGVQSSLKDVMQLNVDNYNALREL